MVGSKAHILHLAFDPVDHSRKTQQRLYGMMQWTYTTYENIFYQKKSQRLDTSCGLNEPRSFIIEPDLVLLKGNATLSFFSL